MPENVTIIGSGPAGLTAAIYAARAALDPFVFEGMMAGGIPGGQLMTTTEVENFPGFPEGGISGPQLMERIRQQATEFGSRHEMEDVTEVDLGSRPFTVKSSEREIETHTLIIATGATARRLGVPAEDRLWNKGMSACAVCDGALPRFKDQHVLVIGGGDSACEESLYMAKYASKVSMVHRRDALRASQAMQQKVLDNDKIDVVWDSVLDDALGEDEVTGARLRDVNTDETREVECAGIFYAIGHTPNTDMVKGQLDMDEAGYINIQPHSTATSVDGVFACGDVADKRYRQAVTAAGTGCAAALDASHWLTAQGTV